MIRTRAGEASFMSATSSANMTVPARRLPYSSVTADVPSAARTEAAIDIIGGMPEPAAMSTWRPGPGQVGGERPPRPLPLAHVTRPPLVHQPARDGAAGYLAHPDAGERAG